MAYYRNYIYFWQLYSTWCNGSSQWKFDTDFNRTMFYLLYKLRKELLHAQWIKLSANTKHVLCSWLEFTLFH